MIGDTPGDLIESDIILNLNETCAIADPSWIKAGKVAWPWWSGRVVTGVEFEGGMNTATQKHYIDFAADYGLEYLLIDAKWYGPHKDPTQDITTTIPEIDLPEILNYARSLNIGVLLWLNWQNTRDQMDKAFPLYEKWGIKGVKIDYMNSDSQEIVNFYHRVVKKAAEHHLLVDFHGSYKPTGIRRTYPNLITREGILGLEHTKWSEKVTPEHNVTIPFTRMLAGPMDYTPGGFQQVTREKFESRYESPMVMGTRCHHLAMFVVYESPLQMCSDYPGAYRGQAGAELIRYIPSTWDETRVLKGKIGDFIAIARKHNEEWFVGVMTDWEPRTLTLLLDFLDDKTYKATIISDGNDAMKNPQSVSIDTIQLTNKDTLTAKMAAGGGFVARLKPVFD
jgi:alpha-glucosidase